MATAYGVYGPKTSYGKESVGITRSTFVIDRAGILRKIYPNLKVDQHADSVLAFLSTLSCTSQQAAPARSCAAC